MIVEKRRDVGFPVVMKDTDEKRLCMVMNVIIEWGYIFLS